MVDIKWAVLAVLCKIALDEARARRVPAVQKAAPVSARQSRQAERPRRHSGPFHI